MTFTPEMTGVRRGRAIRPGPPMFPKAPTGSLSHRRRWKASPHVLCLARSLVQAYKSLGSAAMTLNSLEFATLVVTGFTSCAEFGSYAFVHPVIRHLPPEHHVSVEKGLLKTFGRVMPVLMTLCVVLSLAYAIQLRAVNGTASIIRWSSAIVFVAALVSTIIFNVPINLATGRWNPQDPPQNWKTLRNRWEFFQGARSWLLLIGFILLCLAVAARC
jgi:uncharacterized membrane protein